jgi:hypothetical protein
VQRDVKLGTKRVMKLHPHVTVYACVAQSKYQWTSSGRYLVFGMLQLCLDICLVRNTWSPASSKVTGSSAAWGNVMKSPTLVLDECTPLSKAYREYASQLNTTCKWVHMIALVHVPYRAQCNEILKYQLMQTAYSNSIC